MFHVIRTDGSLEEVPNATCAAIEGEELVCRDERNEVVARFDKKAILIFGAKDSIKELALTRIDAETLA